MGKGYGSGEGGGEGRGEAPSDEGVAAGAGIFIGVTVFFCVCGIPMIVAGVVFLLFFDILRTVGIALLAVSGVLLVGGTVLAILLCAGVIGGKKNQVQNQPQPMVITTSQPVYGQPPAYGQDPGYNPYPPGGANPNPAYPQ